MPDFFQNGPIGTIHQLRDRDLSDLEQDLAQWGKKSPIALVVPCLFSELEGEALPRIVSELASADYLDEIVVGLDNASREQFEVAKKFFSQLPQKHCILWQDGPLLQEVNHSIEALGFSLGESGKGKNVWFCLGYLLSREKFQTIACHDADIKNYDRSLLARLLYPIVQPSFNYAFAKGYYYRSSADQGVSRLHGRVSRLYVTPLIRALATTFGRTDELEYLDSFRYPLAGESAMDVSVARSLRIPSDWGLEIGVLSEVYARYPNARICQVDIAADYDHKHQPLSDEDKTTGLHRMSRDITKAFFRKLTASGLTLTQESFRTLRASYMRTAFELIDHYESDAISNAMSYDREQEETMVSLFGQSVLEAGEDFLQNPTESPFIPSWSEVQNEQRDIFEVLLSAVESDNQEK
ncbi:MAG: glycosyl transferase [Acidimicrobiaceae bacterium]|jgi:glucosyl-3-phosphoglycerate synthase|nr:glycosyl transferase [Acidimicrobiaceae bacterium]|tara:strand:+ start:1395 stop:2624 length:1230 start_codon:yes stop_codon:yes gene_type:complete